ncbi:MAG: hypothetical protein ACRCZF_16320 [Gemmataceae bacterium]
MLLFAQESFWKPPNVYDAISVLGLVLAIASIWYAWWLARRETREQIRTALRVFSQTLDLHDVTEVSRLLGLARAAARNKKWKLAMEFCLEAQQRLQQLRSRSTTSEFLASRVEYISLHLGEFGRSLILQVDGRGQLPPRDHQKLEELILTLSRLLGRLQVPEPG